MKTISNHKQDNTTLCCYIKLSPHDNLGFCNNCIKSLNFKLCQTCAQSKNSKCFYCHDIEEDDQVNYI